MSKNFGSSKFALASATLVLTFIALGLKWIPGSAWVPAVGLILALYGTANVIEKRNGG